MPDDIEASEEPIRYVPKPDMMAIAEREFEAMVVETNEAVAHHWQQRHFWRVRLARRLRWWAFRLGSGPLGPRREYFYGGAPEIKLRQIRKLPFFEQLAVAMVVTDLVLREELVIWLNKKQPRAKRISVDVD